MTRKMSLIFVVLSLVGGSTYLSAQHKVEPRNVTLVRRFILTRSLGMVSGMDHKQNVRLGDKAAQALVIILGDDFSTDPKDVGIYLAIIKTAFLDPESISDPSDRIPKVTLEFLEKMKGKINSPEISALIDECREFVQKQTKN